MIHSTSSSLHRGRHLDLPNSGRLSQIKIPVLEGYSDLGELFGFGMSDIGLVPDLAEERMLAEDPSAKEEPLVITDTISREFRHVLSGMDPGVFSRTVAEAKERRQQAYDQEVRAINAAAVVKRDAEEKAMELRRTRNKLKRRLIPQHHDISDVCSDARLVFLHPNWTLTGYNVPGELEIPVKHQSNSVAISGCRGRPGEPFVLQLRGVCSNISIRNCQDLVLLMDGVLSSLTVSGGGRLSLFITRAFPSPIASRNVRGLQLNSWDDIAHTSMSCSCSHGVIVHSSPRPLVGGDGVLELLKPAPERSCQVPADGVFVLQGGKLTKCADGHATAALTGKPHRVLLAAPDYLAEEPLFGSDEDDDDDDCDDVESDAASQPNPTPRDTSSEGYAAEPSPRLSEALAPVDQPVNDLHGMTGGVIFTAGFGGLSSLPGWKTGHWNQGR